MTRSRRVLLDACVPERLRRYLDEFDVSTARYLGLNELPDGQLLEAIEGRFEVLVTLDTGIAYQNRLAGRSIAMVVMRMSSQDRAAFEAVVDDLRLAVRAAKPGEIRFVVASS